MRGEKLIGEPQNPKQDRGVPAWVPIGIGLVVIGLLAAGVLMVFADLEDSTTTRPEAIANTTTSTIVTTTTSTISTTTSTVPETTTSTTEQVDPWVGWWEASDENGQIDLFIDESGVFEYWDSASQLCTSGGIESPSAWAGAMVGDPSVLSASGDLICHFYGAENPVPRTVAAEFTYNFGTDTLEYGEIAMVRASELPGLPTDVGNPLVGSWSATDSDQTHVIMLIHADGRWESTDSRSGGCERKGFTYAVWSAEGTGVFEMSSEPTMRVNLATFCTTPDGTLNPHSPEVSWTFVYDAGSDTVSLVESDGVVYNRFP